jgi:hypothetical protein
MNFGSGPTQKRKKDMLGRDQPKSFFCRDWPNLSWAEFSPVSWVDPAHIYLIYIYLKYNIYYNVKKIKKNKKNPFKKIVIFSNVFLPILHNIGLYIYTVKYRSGIKIPVFLFKKFLKKN